jgi:hypothetical protein
MKLITQDPVQKLTMHYNKLMLLLLSKAACGWFNGYPCLTQQSQYCKYVNQNLNFTIKKILILICQKFLVEQMLFSEAAREKQKLLLSML